jgi:hypothetical protein
MPRCGTTATSITFEFMEIEIPNKNGLTPEGLKQNQDQNISAKAVPKPEVKITNPLSQAQMPGPTPLSIAAADAVDKWVKAHRLIQNPSQPGMVELSTEHRQFYIDQIDLLRPTVYEDAAAIVFRYQDRTTGQVQVVIIKLDRRDHAISLARAIAWRRIQLFPYGQFIQGTDSHLTDCPPFNPSHCVDHYFRERWHAAAKARLAADQAALTKPLKDAEGKLAGQTTRVAGLDAQRTAAERALADAVIEGQREHDRAETWKSCTQWVIIIIIIIIVFVVHHLWPQS